MADGAQYLSVFLRVGVILTEHLGVGDDIAQGLVRHTPPPFPVFDDIGQIESTVATPPDEGNLPSSSMRTNVGREIPSMSAAC